LKKWHDVCYQNESGFSKETEMNKPSITTTVSTTITKVVKLLPSLRRQLLVELQAAQKDKITMKAAEERYETRKAKIRKLRESTGEESLEFDGYTITNVTGLVSRFDEKKMLAHGLSMAEIESFRVTTPKKAYEKITFPSEKVARRLTDKGDE
jgi:hypothetical protein